MPNSVRVDSLRIHPLKSGAIRALERSEVTPAGLTGDRRWMVVDAAGECVTARNDRALVTISAEPLPDEGLRLTSRSGRTVEVCRPLTSPSDSPARSVTVHGRDAAPGLPLDEPAQALVREVLGRDDVTVLWCSDETVRRLNPDFSRDGDSTAYADGYPVTLASLASLRELNRLGDMDLPIDRFRPNIVIDGDLTPFTEDTWRRVRIGEIDFRVARGVDRCSMTLLDPDTLTTGAEPIRTLSKHRKWEGKTWFCVHLIPEGSGGLAVGDPVSIA
ncbi:MAG TPA: MOSC domain-containing protein [Phycicoccus sp.]|jgi:uncharacterized protein YcbX|nr:MOSC domain-containing protein [Phycicoccus sp.]HQY96725.1 MOSC domain-containing protein [Phycicoccus sp.]HRA45544.1 MOSC domain-containing protein [Phycicoccus sp.]